MSTTWKISLAFLGVFAAGAVFGGFFAQRLARPAPADVAPPRAERPADGQFAVMILKRLSQRLELTPEQEAAIRPIVAQADQEMRRLRREGFRESLAVAERMHAEVATILTEAQRRQLEQMKQAMRERWAQDRHRRWGEGPPPNGEPRRERPRPPPDGG
ncbi:MAG: hypothetical protein KIT44_01770 [Opitutaceae bacterium]|nr:hypothetical protein [Opitutaceae bacterium]